MFALAIHFPELDPVALQIGMVSIKWYGLAYLTGLLLGWMYIRRLLTQPRLWAAATAPFSPHRVDDLLIYITIGVILGGRLGFVLLYEPSYYMANPADVLKVWKGGMSFHGALIGTGLMIWLFARRNAVNVWSTLDLCAAAVPIGLFFGRIANFINAELFGRITDVSWGVIFCNDTIRHYFNGHCPAGPDPRHPSQIYEAALEGLLLFVVLRVLTHRYLALKTPGVVAGTFLIGYGFARSAVELFREPHTGHALNLGPVTAGMFYSIPMIALGLLVLWLQRGRPAQAKA